VKVPHRHTETVDQKAQLAAEFGVGEVFYAESPLWYLRLTGRFTLTWKRELATVAAVFALGLVIGFLAGHR
jgi:hypothetical protein